MMQAWVRWVARVGLGMVLAWAGSAPVHAQTPPQGEVYTACLATAWNLNYHYAGCTRATADAGYPSTIKDVR